MNNKKFNITQKGKEQLDIFKQNQMTVLLDKIVEAKEYPGSEEIEISGNDVIEFSKNFIYRDNNRIINKKNSFMLLSAGYSIFGLVLTIIGIYYDSIEDMLKTSPERAVIVLVGVFMFLIGILSQIFFRYQNRKIRD